MILGVMQPYLFPHLGYYQLVRHCDFFVFYDDVTYIKGGYINRNTLLAAGKEQKFTLSVIKASSNTLIRDLYFSNDTKKLLRSLSQNYRKAPYYDDVFPIVKSVFDDDDRNVAGITSLSIARVFDYLGLDLDCTFSSQVDYDRSLTAAEKLFQLCDVFSADTYCNAEGGKSLYSKDGFKSQGIDLEFLIKRPVQYCQAGTDMGFVDNLSMIDVLMWNSKEEVLRLLTQYDIQ